MPQKNLTQGEGFHVTAAETPMLGHLFTQFFQHML